ncbi:MAG TPA: DUF4126 domain-containing protein [Flavobacteriaceae bacterium]|nr:DUF4126 domain-containing protein [Flavobacteriaceae bacterium]
MELSIETILSIFLGIGLAASVGFRIFVPLCALSVASHFNIIELNENWMWIGSSTAILILLVATFVEILAYFIPWLDNLLDTLAIPLAAIAGTVVMVATISNLDPIITWALAIIAGGGTAAAIKGTTSSARITSTATTAGIANPVVSTIETGSSIVMSIFSIYLPLVAFFAVLFIMWIVYKVYSKLTSSKKLTKN